MFVLECVMSSARVGESPEKLLIISLSTLLLDTIYTVHT